MKFGELDYTEIMPGHFQARYNGLSVIHGKYVTKYEIMYADGEVEASFSATDSIDEAIAGHCERK